jgi:hypothetical protein
MKKPKVGGSVELPFKIYKNSNQENYKVLSIGQVGFYIEVKSSATGRYFVLFEEQYTIIEQEKSKIPWSFFVVFAIALLIIIFNVFVR